MLESPMGRTTRSIRRFDMLLESEKAQEMLKGAASGSGVNEGRIRFYRMEGADSVTYGCFAGSEELGNSPMSHREYVAYLHAADSVLVVSNLAVKKYGQGHYEFIYELTNLGYEAEESL